MNANPNKSCCLPALFVFFASIALCAQEASDQPLKLYKNSVGAYVGLIEANLNYERNVLQGAKSYSNLRMGLGYWTDLQSEGKYFNPSFIHLLGKKKSHIEFDLGFKLIVNGYQHNGTATFLMPDLFVGYRYENPSTQEYFRIGFSIPSIINVGGGFRF